MKNKQLDKFKFITFDEDVNAGMICSYDGGYYCVDEVDKHLEELHKKMEELQQSTQSTICSTSEGHLEDAPRENAKKKLHYYCFTYRGDSSESDSQCYAVAYTGYDEKRITIAIINENKAYAKVTKNAVLISAVYLGYMTEDEVRGN